VLVAVSVLESVLAVAQSVRGENIGIDLFELPGPLYEFGSVAAGVGSFTHPYHLTTLLIVGAAAAGVLFVRTTGLPALATLGGLACIGVAIPLTFSRAVVLGAVPMLALWARHRPTRPAAAVFALGLSLGAVLGFDGLLARVEVSTDASTLDSGRRDRLAEAWRLTESAPVFGVGPGRYVIAMAEIEHDQRLPAHNVVAQAAAETGLPGGALALMCVLTFIARFVRRGALVAAASVSLLPFHLLDAYPHAFALGILITGLWLAVVVVADEAELGGPT
jgi:O-antigen ligase